jgi:hypothetical protein
MLIALFNMSDLALVGFRGISSSSVVFDTGCFKFEFILVEVAVFLDYGY